MDILAIAAQVNEKIDALEAMKTSGDGTVEKVTALAAEIEKLQSQHDALAKADAIAASARAAVNAPVAGAAGVRPVSPKSAKTPTIEASEPNFVKDPKKGFNTPREFFGNVLAVSTGQAPADERMNFLSGHRNKFMSAAGSDEHSRFSDPYGGFLVPVGFIANLLSTSWDGDPIAGRTTSVPMASPVVEIPARVDKDHSTSVSGGFRVYRRAEADTVAASRAQTKLVRLQTTALMGRTFATEELLRDSAVTVLAMIEAGFREEYASELVSERLSGSGVGKYLGVLNSPALVEVAKETGQAADTIVYDNILKMRARAWRYSNAIWMANHDTFTQLAKLNQVIGTGGSNVWMPSINADAPDMLLGRPIIFHEHLETLGDKGDLILVNWSQYLEGTRQGITSDESIHVRFDTYERTFRFTMENAGAPWWESALTPRKGSNTLSPFVALAARA